MEGDRPFRPAPKPEPRRKRTRKKNLSDWRQQVLERDLRCKSCSHRGPADGSHLSAHHLVFRSQSSVEYTDDPRNGLTLCNGLGSNCHHRVHEARLKIEKWWLPKTVVECLSEQGLDWDEEGVPYGPCSKYFAEVVNGDSARGVSPDKGTEDEGGRG